VKLWRYDDRETSHVGLGSCLGTKVHVGWVRARAQCTYSAGQSWTVVLSSLNVRPSQRTLLVASLSFTSFFVQPP
jgi:hypothetical protein